MKKQGRTGSMPLHAAGFWIVLCAAFLLPACGGGGGGGGGTSPSLTGGDIALLSITFPKYTDLSGATTTPPAAAPLSQQVVLTFSGKVDEPVTAGAIRITADPGLDYLGPSAALDQSKNLLPARGSIEVAGNVVIFTPFIPKGEIDLTPNASLDKVPGLLPGFTYRVFVPVGTAGAIKNLKYVDPLVTNPVEFDTISPELPNLFFSNVPKVPPQVVSTDPADGTEGVPVPPLSDPSFPPAVTLTFDQPLGLAVENLAGTDHDGDGVEEQNLFLEYVEPMLYAAVDKSPSHPGYIARLATEAKSFDFVGYTNYGFVNVGLRSVVFTRDFEMLGCSGNTLYDVAYEEGTGTPPVCALTNPRTLEGAGGVVGLTYAMDVLFGGPSQQGLALFALDTEHGRLIVVDPDTGGVETVAELSGGGGGELVDMTLGRDQELYALRVSEKGTAGAVSAVERIDRATGVCTPVLSGLPGDFTGLAFSRAGHVWLFEANALQWREVDLSSGAVTEYGLPISDPLLPSGSRMVFGVKRYELGVKAEIVENHYKGAEVRLTPSGILPFGRWVDIMVRFGLENVSGGNLADKEGRDPLGALCAGRFRTYDPGPAPVEDFFLEEFLDNSYEDTTHGFANAKAAWNVQDHDQAPPQYQHLLAGLGMSGTGELGDFLPLGFGTKIILDTDYQPLPLFNGATPDIVEPTVVKGGIFDFHDIIIPEGVLVMAQGTNPLILRATGDVEIAGTLDVSGKDGGVDTTFNSAYIPTPGGAGGPGGGRGGRGQPPIPPNFSSLTQLQSVPRGERGWGPGNVYQVGGQGGESGAKGEDVPWQGSAQDADSRGAGGGGGSFLQPGHTGYPGKGQYGVDMNGEFYIRDPYDWWDGSWEYDPNWQPGDPYPPKINEFFASEGHNHPHPGEPGFAVFADGDPENDFIGVNGELKQIQGGQGGGGGGSRLDSMNPATKGQAAANNPPLAPSAYDAKGGGGGGGGGGVAIQSLGRIVVKSTGKILARGGRGGGGEVIGHSQFGGGAGGGSGGCIILDSAWQDPNETEPSILLEYVDEDEHAVLDVSGGWGADARQGVNVTYSEIHDPCGIDEKNGKLSHASFCTWSKSDGGYGGYGLIQLMVPKPSESYQLDYHDESVEATLCVIEHEPNYKKTKGTNGFAYYHFTVEGLGPNGSKPFVQHFPTTTDCLVDPLKTISTISAITYAYSKWIDLGQVVNRPGIGGKAVPIFEAFEGVVKLDDTWATVDTVNGYVKNANVAGLNDIVVDAPDLGLTDYIPDSNEVVISFQAADAVVPGSGVPDEANATDWTWDLASLSGHQFIRFRIRFDTARGTSVSKENYKPQVEKVRLRMRY